MPFVSRNEPAVVVEPREQSFDFPAPSVSSQRPAVLGCGSLAAPSVRTDHLDPTFAPQPIVERIAVVGSIADEAFGIVGKETSVECVFDESDLMGRSTRDPGGDRKTRAVCNCHDLGPLPTLRLPDGEAPFLAPAKVPSMKASLMSIPPRW